MIADVAIPTLILMAVAGLVPRIFERVMPETLWGLSLLAFVSAGTLWLLSAAGFALLYRIENPHLGQLVLSGPTADLPHLLWLGAQAALIWGPVLALVVSTAPRRWKTNRW